MSTTSLTELAKFNRYPFSAKQFRDIFDVDFNPGDYLHSKIIPIIEDVFVDKGLRRTIKPKDGVPDIYKTKGVHMLNRTGFIHNILPHIIGEDGKYNGNDFSIIMLDINGVKHMDNVAPIIADHALSRYARALRHKIKAIRRGESYVEAARYGGDEFALFKSGQISEDEARIINEQIMESLSQQGVLVPYLSHSGAKLEMKQISSKVKLISLPTDETDKEIFIAYLKRNQIIEQKDIIKIKGRFGNNIAQIKEYIKGLNARVHIDYGGASTLDEKIKYLCDQHKEILDMGRLATSDNAKQNLLTFVEQKMYNPLFDDIVYSFSHIEDHIKEGEFTHVGWVEAKWIKEANEVLSYYDGDLLMKRIYQSIKEKISPNDIGKIKIANRAGAFMIGFEDGVSGETIDKINKLQSTTINIGNQSVTLPIGVTIESVDGYNRVNTEVEARQRKMEVGEIKVGEMKGKLRNEAEAKWYQNLLQYIAARDDHIDLLNILSEREYHDGDTNRQFQLIHAFFWQKDRGVDRCTKALTALDILSEKDEIYKKIKGKIEDNILPELRKEMDK